MNSALELNCVADVDLATLDFEPLLLVAFASLEGDCVDQHFGSAQGFYTYAVDQQNAALIASKMFKKELKDGNEDKLKPKLAWLAGADIVYCGSIGGSATRQLVTIGVTPMEVKEGPEVEELIEELQTELKSQQPSAQLQRILASKKPKADDRFADMDDEDWEE